MIDWFVSGGPLMWPVLAALIAAVVQIVRGWRARRRGSGPGAPPSTTDSILFWGGFAAVVGLIGTLVGIGVMAKAMETVGSAPASLVWGGLEVALVPTVFGLAVLTLALCGWASLRLTAGRREGRGQGVG